ncbi:hypothetical protein MLD38_012765 [Melastoma candidum]|uniref:Uncharacterized protein n=1 Tax=Melastoma candidum TaxID=119954 RepID=A0ACB9R975_9MYRT|nr:hypothetical protein MLD38_012765 [Melastoma candidum]
MSLARMYPLPDRSLIGPGAVSGDRLSGSGLGGLGLLGKIAGDSAGVAELEGMPAASGVAAGTGIPAAGTGLAGADAGGEPAGDATGA